MDRFALPISLDLRRRRAILALVLFFCSLAFFASGLNHYSADNMEAQDLGHAVKMFSTGEIKLPQDQSPVYYAFLHFWAKIEIDGMASLRLPSAVFSAIAVLLLFLLAEAEFGLAGGALAATLLTFNPMMVFYARLARGYALMAMLAVACLYFAHRYIYQGRRARHLFAMVASALLGIYTHLFFLLFAGSIGLLFLIDLIARRKRILLTMITAVVAILGILPQIRRVFLVTGYTEHLKKYYAGDFGKGHVFNFLNGIAADFFIGQNDQLPTVAKVVLPILVILFVAGLFAARRRGALAGILLIVPTLAAAWKLNRENPIATRYFIYLVPLTSLYLTAITVRLRRLAFTLPLAALLFISSVYFMHLAFPQPPHDWRTAVDFMQNRRQPDEPVVIFPSHWDLTLRRYYQNDEIASVSNVPELRRVLARGKRTFLVQAKSKYFGNIFSFIEQNKLIKNEMSTKVLRKNVLKIFVLRPQATATPDLPKPEAPSILLGGVIGSGGYPWQSLTSPPNPFDRIHNALKNCDLSFAMLENYPPAKQVEDGTFRFLQDVPVEQRQPNAMMLDFIREAGIDGLFMKPADFDPLPLPAESKLKAIQAEANWSTATAQLFKLPGVELGVLYAGQFVFTGKPKYKSGGDAIVAEWEQAVTRAKSLVGDSGRLLVVMPQKPEYDHLLDPGDQMIARRAIELGADAVVGQGGYARKEIEYYRGGVIAYNLGTLVRPPHLAHNVSQSSGMLLRLTFSAGEKAQPLFVPVIFDDQFNVSFEEPEMLDNLVWGLESDPAREHLRERVILTRAGYEERGGKKRNLSEWSEMVNRGGSRHEGYAKANAQVALSGEVSNGRFRRAIHLNPYKKSRVWTDFADVFIGETLQMNYAVPDTAINLLYRKQQVLSVEIDGETVWSETVKFRSGWMSRQIDTSRFAGTRYKITITVESSKMDSFPVNVDPVVLRSPQTVAKMMTEPYSFAEHLREARVVVKETTGNERPCLGPDESFRRLVREEKGPNGEGVIYQRWYCGDLPWDCTALTVQRSNGELRNAIWHHPLLDAERYLTYDALLLRNKIEGFMGFTDLAVKKRKKPIDFIVLIDGQEVFHRTVESVRGWKDFSIDIPPQWRGKEAKVSFVVRAQDPTWRHFCFNAWMK